MSWWWERSSSLLLVCAVDLVLMLRPSPGPAYVAIRQVTITVGIPVVVEMVAGKKKEILKL